MEGFKPTKSPQKTRGENTGAEIVDAGPLLAQEMLKNGDEVFESEQTGHTYVLSERNRRRANKKAAKDDDLHARQIYVQQMKLEKDGSIKPVNMDKPGQQQSGKNVSAQIGKSMVESQQTVLTATARSHGLKVNSHQGAVKALKDEKVEIKHEKAHEKKEKRKHAKAEEKIRQQAQGQDELGKI